MAGLLLFDVLINLPGLARGLSVLSLFPPSIDLLVVCAALLGAARAGERARVALRIVVSVLLAAMLLYEARAWFGLGTGGPVGPWGQGAVGAVVGVAAGAAAAALSFLCAGPILKGFAWPLVQAILLVVVAMLAVAQVATGNRVLSPSEIPRIVRDVGEAFSQMKGT